MMGTAAKITASFLPFLIAAFSLGSCEELAENVDEAKVKIPIKKRVFGLDSLENGGRANEVVLYQCFVDIDVDSVLDAQGLNYIARARANEMVLGIDKPADAELFFLNDAKVTISGDEDFGDEIEIAQTHNINGSDSKVNLEVLDKDVTQEFTNRGVFLRVYATPSMNTFSTDSEIRMFMEGKVSFYMDK
ncbi:MAG: hypothetical protein K9J27_02840 [Bacteroidales bacterium]|nr:hypothetical protein [Bacteroidales bacterium]MCF8333206.1 hypothetical protein [Bacteroidales bacterium]